MNEDLLKSLRTPCNILGVSTGAEAPDYWPNNLEAADEIEYLDASLVNAQNAEAGAKLLCEEYAAMVTWRDIETAPKDGTRVLFAGRWKPFDILTGGEEFVCVALWSSVMSDGVSGYQWYADFLTPLDSVNVDFTHWMPLPKPPSGNG